MNKQEALQKISQEAGDLFVKIVDFAANTAIPNLINFGTKIKDIINPRFNSSLPPLRYPCQRPSRCPCRRGL